MPRNAAAYPMRLLKLKLLTASSAAAVCPVRLLKLLPAASPAKSPNVGDPDPVHDWAVSTMGRRCLLAVAAPLAAVHIPRLLPCWICWIPQNRLAWVPREVDDPHRTCHLHRHCCLFVLPWFLSLSCRPAPAAQVELGSRSLRLRKRSDECPRDCLLPRRLFLRLQPLLGCS